MYSTSTPRAARAALMAAALMVLTLAGHTAGHGALDLLGVGLVGVLAIGFGTAMSGRRLTGPSVLGVLLAGQLLLHLILTFTSTHHAAASATVTPLMVIGHTVAALVATLVVLQADSLIRAWLRLLAATIGAGRPAPLHPERPRALPMPSPLPVGAAILLRHRLVRRGPPAFLAHAT